MILYLPTVDARVYWLLPPCSKPATFLCFCLSESAQQLPLFLREKKTEHGSSVRSSFFAHSLVRFFSLSSSPTRPLSTRTNQPLFPCLFLSFLCFTEALFGPAHRRGNRGRSSCCSFDSASTSPPNSLLLLPCVFLFYFPLFSLFASLKSPLFLPHRSCPLSFVLWSSSSASAFFCCLLRWFCSSGCL